MLTNLSADNTVSGNLSTATPEASSNQTTERVPVPIIFSAPPPPPPPPGMGFAPPPPGAAPLLVVDTKKRDLLAIENPTLSSEERKMACLDILHNRKKGIDELVEKVITLALTIDDSPTSKTETDTELQDIFQRIKRAREDFSALAKAYSKTILSLNFSSPITADSDSQALLEEAKTKNPALMAVLEAIDELFPVIKSLETTVDQPETLTLESLAPLRKNLAVALQGETKKTQHLQENILEGLNENPPPPSLVASNQPEDPFTIRKAKLRAKCRIKTQADIAECTKKIATLKDAFSEKIRVLPIQEIRDALIKNGVNVPIDQAITKMINAEKRLVGMFVVHTKTSASKKCSRPKREQELVDAITSDSQQEPDIHTLIKKIRTSIISQLMPDDFLVVKDDFPEFFNSEENDFPGISVELSHKLATYCLGCKTTSFVAQLESRNLFPSGAEVRETIERSIKIDLLTGKRLSDQELENFYPNQKMDGNQTVDLHALTEEVEQNKDNLLAMLSDSDEDIADRTCSEASDIEDAIDDDNKRRPKP